MSLLVRLPFGVPRVCALYVLCIWQHTPVVCARHGPGYVRVLVECDGPQWEKDTQRGVDNAAGNPTVDETRHMSLYDASHAVGLCCYAYGGMQSSHS